MLIEQKAGRTHHHPGKQKAEGRKGRITGVFLYTYVRKEAVLSSQIEGTQSSLSSLLLFELEEAPGVPLDDVVEVSNYVAAMEHGLSRLREGTATAASAVCW